MKKIVVISALIASIVSGVFGLKQADDFGNMYTLSSVAHAEDNVNAAYNNGVLSVSGLEGKARVIQASYDTNGVLEGVKLHDAVNGENAIPTKTGDRLYIWDSLTGMHPLYDKIIITDDSNDDSGNTTDETGEPVINASEIWDKYDKDPNKYEATYDGELENATGVVTYIGRDSHGTPSMELADVESGISYVLGVFGSYDEMSAVSVGDTVTISGYFHIMSSENMVVLKQCRIKGIYKAETITIDHLNFGRYYKTGSELEPIEWKVLHIQSDKVLLLAEDCIDSLPWHNTHESVTWDNCDLRAWLNNDFLKAAFTAEEQNSILLSDLDNGDDFNYGTPVGQNTKDKVFLLSGAEIEKYLPSSDSRTAKPTKYAISNGAYANGSGDCAWWLRSPGMTETSPAYLSSAGDIGSRAHEVNETIIGVRPAIWIDSAYMRSIVQN